MPAALEANAALTVFARERAALEAAYAQRTPRSREQFERAITVLPGGNTRSNLYFPPYPPVFKHAGATQLSDADGNVYDDFLCDYTVAASGHADPRVAAALERVVAHGWSWGGRGDDEVRLAEAIRARFPSMARLRFVNSGTEASLYALATARAFTGRPAVVVIDGGYHGGVLSFTETVPRLNVPGEFLRVPYNDAATLDATLRTHGDRVAAVMMEPVLNSGGCIPATRDYLENARRAAHAAGALFVLDEVMTARLGWGGVQGTHDLVPDLCVLGKIIGGGLPCGAFGGSAELLEMYDGRGPNPVAHNGSFNNNRFTMAAGLTALTEVLTREAMDAMNTLGDALRGALNDVLVRAGIACRFVGVGSVMALHRGVELPLRPTADPLLAPIRELLHLYLLNAGFWIGRRGMVVLSVRTDAAMCDRLVAALDEWATRYREPLGQLA